MAYFTIISVVMAVHGEKCRIMALDYGKKRVGIAISDPHGIIAQPLCTLEIDSQQELLEKLRSIIIEKHIGLIVIGDPISHRGKVTRMSKEIRQFASRIEQVLGIHTVSYDERFTSQLTSNLLKEHGVRKKKANFDGIVASVMLHEYLQKNEVAKG